MANAQRLADSHGMLEVHHSEGGLELELTGEWRALCFGEIEGALARVDLTGVRRVEISTTRLAVQDTSTGFLRRAFLDAGQR